MQMTNKPEPKRYTCAKCGGVFDEAWPNPEAVAEMHARFGEDCSTDDCDIVCDDCYHELVEFG